MNNTMTTPPVAPSTVLLAAFGSSGLFALIMHFLTRGRDRRKDDVAEKAQEIVNHVALVNAENQFSQTVLSRLTVVEADLKGANKEIAELRGQQLDNTSQIAELRREKGALEHLIENLKSQVLHLTAEIARYNENEISYQAVIDDLNARLAAKTAELRIAQDRLVLQYGEPREKGTSP